MYLLIKALKNRLMKLIDMLICTYTVKKELSWGAV